MIRIAHMVRGFAKATEIEYLANQATEIALGFKRAQQAIEEEERQAALRVIEDKRLELERRALAERQAEEEELARARVARRHIAGELGINLDDAELL